MNGTNSRLGLIIPSSNTTMELEFWNVLSRVKKASLHIARVPSQKVTVEDLKKMVEDVEAAATLLSDCAVDVIVFGCTSGSFLEGKGYDERLTERIEEASNITAITTSGAVVSALNDIGTKSLILATPYSEELNQRGMEFLESHHFRVAAIEGLGILDNLEIGRLVPLDAYNLVKKILNSKRDAEIDTIFMSCTNMRTFEILNSLETDTGLHVVSSNQASLWAAFQSVGIDIELQEISRLFPVIKP